VCHNPAAHNYPTCDSWRVSSIGHCCRAGGHVRKTCHVCPAQLIIGKQMAVERSISMWKLNKIKLVAMFVVGI
jgi:hypothetical protein